MQNMIFAGCDDSEIASFQAWYISLVKHGKDGTRNIFRDAIVSRIVVASQVKITQRDLHTAIRRWYPHWHYLSSETPWIKHETRNVTFLDVHPNRNNPNDPICTFLRYGHPLTIARKKEFHKNLFSPPPSISIESTDISHRYNHL